MKRWWLLTTTAENGWRFTATVSVQAKPEPADWTQLEVPAPEPEVPQDLVEHELEVLRSSVAELAPARFESYQKQLRELAAIARKKDKKLANAEAKKWKHLHKDARSRTRVR